MPSTRQDFPTSPDATVCVELFTYIFVVFFLVKLGLNELGHEAERLGGVPPRSLLYLAAILLWPVTAAIFTGLFILGLLEAIFVKAYSVSAWVVGACRRRITSFSRNRPWVGDVEEDVEMAILEPPSRDGVTEIEAVVERVVVPQAQMIGRELIETLKEECGLTRDEWG
ncbi:hypothetical protein diail_5527 [Diaporthe ilicicola]|nr:hypothetical protein diail_5527 [Diaporthe ilicicola]